MGKRRGWLVDASSVVGEVAGLAAVSVVEGAGVAPVVVGSGAVIVTDVDVSGGAVLSTMTPASTVVGPGVGGVSLVVSGTEVVGADISTLVGGGAEGEVGGGGVEVAGDGVGGEVGVGGEGEEVEVVAGGGKEVERTVVTSADTMGDVTVATAGVTPVATVV